MEGVGRSLGRLSAVVSGSRKSASMAGLIEPPVWIRAALREGASLYSLSQPAIVQSFPALRRDLTRLFTAGFLGRLFLAACPEGLGEEQFFELLVSGLEGLGDGISPPLCGFWVQDQLLGLLGLAPQVDQCVNCGSSDPAGYSAPAGGVLCVPCYRGEGFALGEAGLEFCRSVRHLPLSHLSVPSSEVVRMAGRLYKEHYCHHLGLREELFRRVLPKGGTS